MKKDALLISEKRPFVENLKYYILLNQDDPFISQVLKKICMKLYLIFAQTSPLCRLQTKRLLYQKSTVTNLYSLILCFAIWAILRIASMTFSGCSR